MESKDIIVRIDQTREDAVKGLNGSDMALEVDGKPLWGQMKMTIEGGVDEAATCTVKFLMPDIRYKGE